MEYLLALLGVLFGAFIFVNTKRKSAEALLENVETKEKLLEKDKEILSEEAKLKMEEEKRALIEATLKEKKKELSIDEMENFFNRPQQ
jgi:hypothetical protein